MKRIRCSPAELNMFNKNFLLRAVVLIAAHWSVLTSAKEICVWCDPRMSMRFTNCLFMEIVSDPALDVLERELLLDMRSSLFAASMGIKSSPDPVKNQIMNGALTGELSGMISSHSALTGQRPEVATDEIMRLIGYCYFSVTEQSEVHFVNSMRKAVIDIIKDSDDYQDDGAVSTSYQFSQNSKYASEISNQPQPNPANNILSSNDAPRFDNNYSDRSTQGWPQKTNAVAVATSTSNRNFDDRAHGAALQSAPNNPNRDFVVSFVNQDFDSRPSGMLPNSENLPLNPVQNREFPAPSHPNQVLNGPKPPAGSQTRKNGPSVILPNNQVNSFQNQDLRVQSAPFAQPKNIDTQPQFPPNSDFNVPLSDQYFENRVPFPELSPVQKSVAINYSPANNQGFAPLPNKDLVNQPFSATPNVYQNGQGEPTPNRQFPDASNSNSDFSNTIPQIRETVLTNSFTNNQGPVSFPREDLNDQRPNIAQTQSFENMPNTAQTQSFENIPNTAQAQSFGNMANNAQQGNQFSSIISNNGRNPVLRQLGYDYPAFIRENFQNNLFREGTKSFAQSNSQNENNGLPLKSSYLTLNTNQEPSNVQNSFRLFETPAVGASNADGSQTVGIRQQYQNNGNVFGSPPIAPSAVFGTYDTGQQVTLMQQGASGIVQSFPQTPGQNIPNNAWTDELSPDNSRFVEVYPPEQNNMNFQPMGPGSYQPGPNEDQFQNGIIDKKNSEECAMKFSETLFVHLLKTKIIHSVFGTNTLPSSVKQTASEAIRRAFIDNCVPEYADQVAEYSSQQIGSLPESSSTQAYADKISKSVSDILYRNDAIRENCYNAAISMTSAITRWLEAFAFEKTTTGSGPMLSSNSDDSSDNSSADGASDNPDENQQSKNNSSATSASEKQEDDCDDEVEDSSMQETQNGKADNQDEFCEGGVDESSQDLKISDDTRKSKLSDVESKSHFKVLMSAIKSSMSYDGFSYPRFTSAMSSVASSIGNKHPDWNSDEVINRVYVETIAALTLILQETAMSRF